MYFDQATGKIKFEALDSYIPSAGQEFKEWVLDQSITGDLIIDETDLTKIKMCCYPNQGSSEFLLYTYDDILNGNVVSYQTSYGKSSGKLNWDTIVSKKGESRIEHINRHAVPNNSRETHGVFNGNPVDMVNDAWQQRGMVEPISDGMGGSIYNIPYKNAGYESGYVNTGAEMDYITIVVMDESNDLITAFPSFGDYSK